MRALLVSFLLAVSPAVALAQETPLRTISVTGSGIAEAEPDMALISLAVTRHDPDAAAAMAAVSADVRKVLDKLSAAGVEDRDMQTDRLSIQPVWDNNRNNSTPPRVIGFTASNGVSVRLRDLSNVGDVLNMVIKEGANDFSGIQFTLQDPKPSRDAARAEAVADATDKARQMAEAAGVTLGQVRTMTEGHVSSPRPMMQMARMESVAQSVPIAAGEVGVMVSVSMVFEIE